ncbi:hypothetical protein [uncultured Gilvimarinus sp.]|uniref:hypothetical protein n=1 Tax=uncultured Gilvimarinus sp. TaxID=1689143 RepID=UPI0030D839AD
MNLNELVIKVSGDFISSPWWDSQDSPGVDRIKEASEHINNGEQYASFKKTEEGSYLLSVLEAYECSFNDADWLPYEIVGLPIDKARTFIGLVNREVAKYGASRAIPYLRQHYESLTK